MATLIAAPTAAEHAVPSATMQAAPATAGRRLDAVLIVACATAAVVLCSLNTNFAGFAEDEGTYTSQARALWHGTLSQYWYWYDHPPGAWIQLSPLLWLTHQLGLGGDLLMEQARLVAGLYLGATAALLYVLGRRFLLSPWLAAGGVVVFLASPLVQDQFRRVYIDNFAMPWLLLAFVVALRPRPHRWDAVVAGAAMAIAALSKETALLMLPALLVLIVTRTDTSRARAAGATLASMACVGALYPLYAASRGELGNLLSTLKWQLLDRAGSGDLLDPSSARHRVVTGWLDLDAFLVIGGLVAALLFVLLARTGRSAALALAVVLPFAFVILSRGYLPGMFVIAALPFLALSLAALSGELVRRSPKGWHPALASTLGTVAVLAFTIPAMSHVPTLSDNNRAHELAVLWVGANVPRDATVLVDDSMQANLYSQGRTDTWENLWVHKLDTDPYAPSRLPHGWKDIDYLVATPALYGALDQPTYTQGRAALRHSQVVETIQDSTTTIDIRRVLR